MACSKSPRSGQLRPCHLQKKTQPSCNRVSPWFSEGKAFDPQDSCVMLSINEVYHPGPIVKRHDWLMTRFLATDKDVLFCCAVNPFGVRADRLVGPVEICGPAWELGGILQVVLFAKLCSHRTAETSGNSSNARLGNWKLYIANWDLSIKTLGWQRFCRSTLCWRPRYI